MTLKANEEECCVCGQVFNRYWMHSILTGKSGTKWICPECYKNGQPSGQTGKKRGGK